MDFTLLKFTQFVIFTISLTTAAAVTDLQCNVSISREPGRCIMFGTGTGSLYDHPNGVCLDNSPARHVSSLGDDFYKLLSRTCPEYAKEDLVCCDYSQLISLSIQLDYPKQLFGRCPACLKNFVDHFCAMACDPNQALYMNPNSCEDGKNEAGERAVLVTAVDVYLSLEYAYELYQSCSEVKSLSYGGKVLNMMCGGGPCHSPNYWLHYLGDPRENHFYSSLSTNYIIGDYGPPGQGIKPKHYSFVPCNTTCRCVDCTANPRVDCLTPLHPANPVNTTLIVRAKEPIYTVFQPIGVIGVSNWTFGPVFTNDVLHEVFNLQDHLIKMVAKGTLNNGKQVGVAFDDICRKPLAPVNNNCAILSVLNYFQNNLTRLEYTEYFGLVNNSYHIYFCTRDPTADASSYYNDMNIPCLGAFGGPVNPNTILGGFNYTPNGGPNYNNATSLRLSFILDEHMKDNQLVTIWEKAFKDYVMNYKGLHIDINMYT